MNRFNFKKVLTLMALLLLVGQTVIPTTEVFAETATKTEQSSQSEAKTEQTDTATDKKEVSTDSVEENSTLPSSTEPDETNQSNAPPASETTNSSDTSVTTDVKDLLDETTDTTNEASTTEDAQTLTTDADGNIYYNGEKLFYEDGKVPANMEELFKKGVTSKFRSVGGASIQYNGAVSWGYYTVGNFSINGQVAFCMQHPLGTPATGTANNGLNPYENNAVRAILYWGWGGPKNIFGSSSEGIVATSLALSHVFYGDTPGTPPSGYYTLLTKANAGDVPDNNIAINNKNSVVNLAVSYNKSTGIQKSATATLNAHSSNSISFSIPSGIKFVNESTGKTATSGTVSVSGGQKYHFEADAKTAATITKNNLKGTIKEFQPLIVKPNASGLQTLGTWRWYQDPAQTVSFKATFVKRNGNAQLTKVDSVTGAALKGAKFQYTIDGTTKTATTNANGVININDILDGKKITIKEVTAPTGYVLNATPQTVTIKAGETVKVKFTNKKIMGSVKLLKYADEDWKTGKTNTFLEGAEFTIYKADGKTKVQSQTTDANGELTFKNVEYGIGYILKETKTPEGYQPVENMTFDLTTDGQVIQLTATDKVIHEDMKLIKYDDESTGAILSKDAQFTITNLQTNLKVTQKDELGQETSIFTTNENGEILLPQLTYGKYRIEEVKSPFGYLQLSKPVDFFINGKNNGILTVKVGNKVVKGKVEMTKTGEKATSVVTEDTEYGTLYLHQVSQETLKDVTFDIYARQDVITGDGIVHAKKDDKVGTYTTDENGKFTSDELYIGSYYAVEKSAPNGYIVKTDEIDFTINYEGEVVPLTSSSITAENNWNKAKITVNKLDESLVGYEDNQIQTEEVNSNGKVFGLFRTDAYTVGDIELSPADALVGLATTEDGKATFEGKYPDGNYYAKELNAGDSHVINNTKYPVTLTPTDNREELESNVYADATFLNNENFNRMARNPIVNKLFKTSVPFEKINETSKLEQGIGYIYEYNQLGEGAEFELSNADGKVIQTATIDKEGRGNWKDLVVGDYTFKETKTSNDSLVLDETVYGIKVTQEKTTITDTKDGTVLAEVDNTAEAQKQSEAVTRVDEPEENKTDETTQSDSDTTKDEETTTSTSDALKEDETANSTTDTTKEDETATSTSDALKEDETTSTDNEVTKEEVKEPIITLKNKAIRGRSELDKTDVSDGKKLPNTGIEIKDEKGNVVVKGRTDKNGNFTFDNLPKGKYTFTEYEAPKGYVIDSTPIPFEIKEDGDVAKCQMTNVKEADKLRQTKARNDVMMALTVMAMSIAGFTFIVRSKRDESLY